MLPVQAASGAVAPISLAQCESPRFQGDSMNGCILESPHFLVPLNAQSAMSCGGSTGHSLGITSLCPSPLYNLFLFGSEANCNCQQASSDRQCVKAVELAMGKDETRVCKWASTIVLCRINPSPPATGFRRLAGHNVRSFFSFPRSGRRRRPMNGSVNFLPTLALNLGRFWENEVQTTATTARQRSLGPCTGRFPRCLFI